MTEQPTRGGTGPAIDPGTNLVLRQLVGMRREMAAIRENQARDRELITRVVSRMDEHYDQHQREIRDLRSDLHRMENELLNRHNQVLDILTRLDEADTLRTAPLEPLGGMDET